MKHLKTYENKKYYLIGDYVRLRLDISMNLRARTLFKVVKILKRSILKASYRVEGFYLDTNERTELWIGENDIDRKPTLKEIKEFELKKDADKYNL